MIALLAVWALTSAAADAPLAAAPPKAPAAPAAALPTAAAVAPAKDPKAEKVCWEETPTGTLFSHKVCATRQEVEERRRHDQDWKMHSNWDSSPKGN